MWLFQANVQKGFCIYSARFLFNLCICGNDPITFFLIGMAVCSRSCLKIPAFEVTNSPVSAGILKTSLGSGHRNIQIDSTLSSITCMSVQHLSTMVGLGSEKYLNDNT